LNNLGVICQGVEAYIAEGVKEGFGSDTTTTIYCTLGETRRGRGLVATRRSLLVYEKPVLVTVMSTFANYKKAPRQFGFDHFLEGLMVSDDLQDKLPNYIQEALGDNTEIEGVHISSLESSGQPVLILAFGPDAPTASPSAIVRSGEMSPSPFSGACKVQYYAASMVTATTIAGGIIMMMS